MAEDEEEESGSTQGGLEGDWNGGQQPGPENGRGGAALQLAEMVVERLSEEDGLRMLIETMLAKAKDGHGPSASTIVALGNLLDRLKKREEVPREEYESLALVLWRSVRGTRNQGRGTGGQGPEKQV